MVNLWEIEVKQSTGVVKTNLYAGVSFGVLATVYPIVLGLYFFGIIENNYVRLKDIFFILLLFVFTLIMAGYYIFRYLEHKKRKNVILRLGLNSIQLWTGYLFTETMIHYDMIGSVRLFDSFKKHGYRKMMQIILKNGKATVLDMTNTRPNRTKVSAFLKEKGVTFSEKKRFVDYIV